MEVLERNIIAARKDKMEANDHELVQMSKYRKKIRH